MSPRSLSITLDVVAGDMISAAAALSEYSPENAQQMLGAAQMIQQWAEQLLMEHT